MLDQAETLRQRVLEAAAQMPASDHQGGLLVVVGAQPGVGASTVAAQLAWQLYRQGCPVGLVELGSPPGREATDACAQNALPARGALTQNAALGRGAFVQNAVLQRGACAQNAALQRGDAPHARQAPAWQDIALGYRTLREAWRLQESGLPRLGCRTDGGGRSNLGGTMPLAIAPQTAAVDSGTQEQESSCLLGPWGVQQLQLAATDRLVVVDAGLGSHLHRLLPVANHCCVVVDCDEQQTAAQYACLKHLSTYLGGSRCWLALNRQANAATAAAIQHRLVATADRFLNLALSVAGCLPQCGSPWSLEEGRERRAWQEEDWGSPVWREAVARMARLLEEAMVGRTTHPRPVLPWGEKVNGRYGTADANSPLAT